MTTTAFTPAPVGHRAPTPGEVAATATVACQRIAPLWPLDGFVAVNPYLGLADMDFASAATRLARVAGARSTLSRSHYAEAIAGGRITDTDLAAALADAGGDPRLPGSVHALKELARGGDGARFQTLPTVAEVAATLTGKDWPRIVGERLSSWAGGYFDEGQAAWSSPWRDLPAYAAWRAEAAIDRTPEVMGLAGLRAAVRRLPTNAGEAVQQSVRALGIPGDGLEPYLHRLLAGLGGWAGLARQRGWQASLAGTADDSLEQLLAVSLAWELLLHGTLADAGIDTAWSEARERLAEPDDEQAGAALAADLVLQSAYERAWQRELCTSLATSAPADAGAGPEAEAVFCIDVRSEVFRRSLEQVAPTVRTGGFAGFFGIPLERVAPGETQGEARCPVLLAPGVRLEAAPADKAAGTERSPSKRIAPPPRALYAWRSFRAAAAASFAQVETLGLAFAARLLADSLGATGEPQSQEEVQATGRGPLRDAGTGHLELDTAARVELAAGILRAMSRTTGLPALVALVGHGATTVNNPHAAGLDCGACGGHAGDANARAAAALLNDEAVRAGLAEQGIRVGDETVFVACLHDTTTDEVHLLDAHEVPASHAAAVNRLQEQFNEAGALTRRERALRLMVEPSNVDAGVRRRSQDWSEVRPEWGLAGCAAFVAAPRARTARLDLGGRAFLHDYQWRDDREFGVLELVMTAPMVVASWINLQYYGSSVDNRVFGSGNKTLHNVAGRVGVLEGAGGELRVGLPWQSVHDGKRLTHEPMRLSVFIEAPVEAMNAIVERHEPLRHLLDNGWLHLFAIDEKGQATQHYDGGLSWRELESPQQLRAA